MQEVSVGRISGQFGGKKLERNASIGKSIAGQPDFRHAAGAQPSNERISARQLRTFFQDPHE
jgi:hypothetical protein